MAFAKYIGNSAAVNLEYEKYGRAEDFIINTFHIDIKSKQYRNDSNVWYIKAFSDNSDEINNRLSPLHCDLYVFTTVQDRRRVLPSTVKLCGWMKREDIQQIPPRKSPLTQASHWNYEIFPTQLRSMEELLALLQVDFHVRE